MKLIILQLDDPLQGINLDHLLSGNIPCVHHELCGIGVCAPSKPSGGESTRLPRHLVPGDLVRSWSVCMWVGESMRGWVHVNTCGALGVLVQPALSEDCHVKMS